MIITILNAQFITFDHDFCFSRFLYFCFLGKLWLIISLLIVNLKCSYATQQNSERGIDMVSFAILLDDGQNFSRL